MRKRKKGNLKLKFYLTGPGVKNKQFKTLEEAEAEKARYRTGHYTVTPYKV